MQPRRSRLARWILALSLPLALIGCLPAVITIPVGETIEGEILVQNANEITAVAPVGDGRVFFAERTTGLIRVIVDGVLQEAPFADLLVNSFRERGLLDIAVSPNFATDGRLYALYSRSSTAGDATAAEEILDHRVVFFTAVDNVAEGGEALVLSLPAGSTGSRIGGKLTFGPDGQLYVAVGDFADPPTAQDPASPYGKVHRLTPDGAVPADNPTAGSSVFASGLRFPQGLTFDPISDNGFIIDHPTDSSTEIHPLRAGANFGWPTVVGNAETPAELDFVAMTPDFRPPVLFAILGEQFVGLSVNPGSAYGPQTEGDLMAADRAAGTIVSMPFVADRTALADPGQFAANFPSALRDLAFTPAGTLYVATQDEILRLIAER